MSPDARADPEVEFQFHDLRYETDTALAGMWLFLASEVLFFGALFLAWCYCRTQHPGGFAAATRDTWFSIGTANTVILVTSSLAYACAVAWGRRGDNRRVFQACVATMLLGLAFIGLKALEWYLDLSEHEIPGVRFKPTPGDSGGAQLFWVFYYASTVLHAIHLGIGVLLVGWIAWRAWRRQFSPRHATAIEVVGLYWSFVDMVWMVLYPLIYLAGRAG